MAGIDSNIISGISSKPMPLFSFRCIVDLDMSLVKYIIINFRDNPVFDMDKVKSMTYMEILSALYERDYENPLYLLMKYPDNKKQKELLDRCYEEFLTEHEEDILKYAVGTAIYDLIISYKKSGDINPYILYYNETEKKFLDNIKALNSIPKISLTEATAKKYGKQITQYFFKSLVEVIHFKDMEDKVFYFSTCGLNMIQDDEGEDLLLDNDSLKVIYNNRCNISVFDMYNMDILKRNKGDK